MKEQAAMENTTPTHGFNSRVKSDVFSTLHQRTDTDEYQHCVYLPTSGFPNLRSGI